MHIRLRLLAASILFGSPLLAHAAPDAVTGISAVQNEAGIVEVYWNQVASNDIAGYRVFYSHESILENDGRYDDFEIADGSVNAHALFNIPPVADLYVSVLAVNAIGEESPYFVEEAHVILGASAIPTPTPPLPTIPPEFTGEIEGSNSSTMQASSTPASSAPPMKPMVQSLIPLSVEALSATGVSIKFNTAIRIDPARAVGSVRITTASGMDLQLRRYVIDGDMLTVHTETHVRGRPYKVVLSSAIEGVNPDGTTVTPDATQAPLLFPGHASGKEPLVQAASFTPAPAPVQYPEVRNLRMNAEELENNTYIVNITWEAPADSNIKEFRVAQSTDGGKTFSSDAATNGTAARINGVSVKNYTIRVRTVYADGKITSGATQSIALPKAGGLTGSVVPDGKGTNLPSSGPAMIAIAVTSAAGAWRLRKIRVSRNEKRA